MGVEGGTLSANITKGSDRTNVNGQKEGMTHLTAATGSFLIASSHFKETRSTLGQWSEDEPGYLIWHCGYQLVGEKTGATQKQEMPFFLSLCVSKTSHELKLLHKWAVGDGLVTYFQFKSNLCMLRHIFNHLSTFVKFFCLGYWL